MATSTSQASKYPIFRTSIDKLFNGWQALQIAIENGQGGTHGKSIAIWMRQAVEDFFYQNDDLEGDEVAEFIGTLMDQELDTIVDDNSLDILGETLVQHFKLAASGKNLELEEIFKKLDEEAAKPKPKAASQNANDESSSEESDSNEEMEIDDDNSTHNSSTSGHNASMESQGPSNHRAGRNFVTEPDEDGWVTVTKSKKSS